MSGRKAECLPGCGMCCLCQPEILPQERSYFRTSHPKAMVRNGSGGFSIALKKGQGSCVFMNNRKCDIYGKRPTFCRQYPFHFYAGDRISAELDLSCRGVWTGRGADAESEARQIASESQDRMVKALRESKAVYEEFYSICTDAGVMGDTQSIRADISSNIQRFADPMSIAEILAAALDDDPLSVSGIDFRGEADPEELRAEAMEASLSSMSSEDPLNLPVYCGQDFGWNMFQASGDRVTWYLLTDAGDLEEVDSVRPESIQLGKPDAEGMRVLTDYIGLLNSRESFLGSVFYKMDDLGYEDPMENVYAGSLAASVADLMWRASMLDAFMGTGFGADGIRETIIFYDMDRLDAPAVGAFI
ncbi:MAG: YkgJ family cysteine cluster protein [Candidatus Methanomethylophilaceae archaeon]|nr:YkgJ family cysteine cluster protein [Candidatus Methanomethylophilaceae archaeon]